MRRNCRAGHCVIVRERICVISSENMCDIEKMCKDLIG